MIHKHGAFRYAAFLLIPVSFLGFIFLLGILLSNCKTPPVPPPRPKLSASLGFGDVEAEDPGSLRLPFSLEIGNPPPESGRIKIESWRLEINGRNPGSGFTVDCPDGTEFPLTAGPDASSFSFALNLDMAVLSALGYAPADDYEIRLTAELSYFSGSEAGSGTASPEKLEALGSTAFPGVRPPVFSITSIAILKAELINTRFRVGLKIENPNPFPVELSSLSYELYGNGRLWADGRERNVFKVNGKSALQGNLFLLMNFINMKRDLLDQIILLQDVNYRFAGDVQVGTGVEYLPSFSTGFDLSGYSEVFDN